MSAYVDFKITSWVRVPVKDEKSVEEVLELLKNGVDDNLIYTDLRELLDFYREEVLCEDFVEPRDNKYDATFELCRVTDGVLGVELLWSNKPSDDAS